MNARRFSDWERALAAEKSAKYRGSASIKLNVLHFQGAEDAQNTTRLRELFHVSGTDRLDVRNHVQAIIDPQSFETAVRDSGRSADMLMDSPQGSYYELEFRPGFRLQCLHGLDRIQAAAETLPPEDRRWVVDLYHEDINDDLKTTLIEDYACEKQPDDGEFYCKIRQHQRSGHAFFEMRWLARLKAVARRKKQNLDRVLKHSDYRCAFDCQLDMPGLAGGMSLGTLHKMFAMKCEKASDPETICYLNYVKDTWTRILGADVQAMQKLDRHTVKVVELTAPGACQQDADKLYHEVKEGRIFAAFSERERETIWRELLAVSVDRLIPSLASFFEDVKYLQGPAECVKRLMDVQGNDHTFCTLKQSFSGVNQYNDAYMVQVSESQLTARPGNADDQLDLGYRQLWIIGMRKYLDIQPRRKKAAGDLLAQIATSENVAVLVMVATLAYKLGFDTREIRALLDRSPDREIARRALLKARDPKQFQYEANALELYIGEMVRLFDTATVVLMEDTNATQSRYSRQPPHRCGIPRTRDHQHDQAVLFVDKLHGSVDAGAGVTSFFVRRSVYLAFFGRPRPTGTGNVTLSQMQSLQPVRGLQVDLRTEQLERAKHEHAERERLQGLVQEKQHQQAREQTRLDQLARDLEEQKMQHWLAQVEQQREQRRLETLAQQFEEQQSECELERSRLARLELERLARGEEAQRLWDMWGTQIRIVEAEQKSKGQRLDRLQQELEARDRVSQQARDKQQAERQTLDQLAEIEIELNLMRKQQEQKQQELDELAHELEEQQKANQFTLEKQDQDQQRQNELVREKQQRQQQTLDQLAHDLEQQKEQHQRERDRLACAERERLAREKQQSEQEDLDRVARDRQLEEAKRLLDIRDKQTRVVEANQKVEEQRRNQLEKERQEKEKVMQDEQTRLGQLVANLEAESASNRLTQERLAQKLEEQQRATKSALENQRQLTQRLEQQESQHQVERAAQITQVQEQQRLLDIQDKQIKVRDEQQDQQKPDKLDHEDASKGWKDQYTKAASKIPKVKARRARKDDLEKSAANTASEAGGPGTADPTRRNQKKRRPKEAAATGAVTMDSMPEHDTKEGLVSGIKLSYNASPQMEQAAPQLSEPAHEEQTLEHEEQALELLKPEESQEHSEQEKPSKELLKKSKAKAITGIWQLRKEATRPVIDSFQQELSDSPICIEFHILEGVDTWVVDRKVWASPANPKPVRYAAMKYSRKFGGRLLRISKDSDSATLSIESCIKAVVEDGTTAIFVHSYPVSTAASASALKRQRNLPSIETCQLIAPATEDRGDEDPRLTNGEDGSA